MVAPHILLGRRGERIACRFLLREGFDILARRYQVRSGELDIVAFEKETLAFIEVKTRSSSGFGEPHEFVDWQKQQILRRAADQFIAEHDLGGYPYRFDIVSVLIPAGERPKASLFRNAF